MNSDNRASLLSLVRPQIDATLALVQEAMARHVAQPPQITGNPALAACPLQLHQVYGALRMVRLEGATRYAVELESALRSALRASTADSSEIQRISEAISALREFVADVAAGGTYLPLRLYPAYRELAKVGGNESATEKDLFFPDPTIESPPHAEPRAISPAVMPALLKELRSRFQRGLLAWLKESTQAGGLKQMREVLDTLHKISAGLPPPRGLWWAGIALAETAIDALPDPQHSDWVARLKPVCSRIDFLLRDLAAGTSTSPYPAQRDVLYALAVSRMDTPRVREVRSLFALDSLLPAAKSDNATQLKPILDDITSRLDNIKDTWTQYAAGEPRRLAHFRDLLAPLTEKSRVLECAPLTQLLEAISLATAGLPDPYPLDGQVMSLEMASALLMAESIVLNIDELPDDLLQQVGIMRSWLAEAAQGKLATTPPPGLRADIVQKVNDANLRIATAREILKSLGQVEKAVEAFARDRGQPESLAPLTSILHQVNGVFLVSNQKRAARLTTVCQRLIERCANPANTGITQDIEWVAEGLGSLGFYLEPCLQGKLPAERAVNMFFTRYEQAAGDDAIFLLTSSMPAASDAASTTATTAPTATPSAAPAIPASVPHAVPPADGIDREMLEVFLEESSEVLAAIESAATLLSQQAGDHDALLTVRRAFHTLKGSARMVGLHAFGECAWALEEVLNHWRAQSLVATPELLALVSDARERLAQWAHALQGESDPEVDTSDITARARLLRGAPAEVTPPPMPRAVASEATSTPIAADTVAMGEVHAPADPAAGPSSLTPVVQAASPDDTPTPLYTPAPSPAAQCDQALADLGDRLAWINGLIDEIREQTDADPSANARLREIAQMMQESMAEADALKRSLGEHIAALKHKP